MSYTRKFLIQPSSKFSRSSIAVHQISILLDVCRGLAGLDLFNSLPGHFLSVSINKLMRIHCYTKTPLALPASDARAYDRLSIRTSHSSFLQRQDITIALSEKESCQKSRG